MISYQYAPLTPPAPMLNVSIRCAVTGATAEGRPALLDTAADRTVLPAALVQALRPPEAMRLKFQGFGSSIMELPVFLVVVTIHDLPGVQVLAALGEDEQYVLLGRDVLNHFCITLDGPNRSLKVTAPGG